MAVVGIDPVPYLTNKDPFLSQVMIKVFEEAIKQREIMDHNLASRIADEVAKRFG